MFESEYRQIVEQEVVFEWKQILCSKCKNFGHNLAKCMKENKEIIERKAQEVGVIEPQMLNNNMITQCLVLTILENMTMST